MIRLNGLKCAKRIAALLLSAAMVIGEGSVAMAASSGGYYPNMDSAVEEVTEASEVTGDYTPGKVQNVGFRSYVTGDIIDQYKLSWDAVQSASGYRLRVTDMQGYEYISYRVSDSKTGKYTQAYYNSTNNNLYQTISNFSASKAEIKDGSYEYVLNADGKHIYMKANTKYNVQVCAVYYSNNKYTYGPWSDPVSFTTPGNYTDKVSDVRIEQSIGGNYVLRYSSTSSVQVEIKDAAGNIYCNDIHLETDPKTGKKEEIISYHTSGPGKNAYYYLGDNLTFSFEKKPGEDFYQIKADSNGNPLYAFEPGKAYTIRLRAFYSDENGIKHEGEWSAPVSVNLSERVKPAKVGNVDVGSGKNYFNWNYMDSYSGFEYEVKDSAGKTYVTGDSNQTGNRSLYFNELYQAEYNSESGYYNAVYDENNKKIYANKPGMKYSIKVRAYNNTYKYDFEKHSFQKLYGEWSDVFTYTMPNKVFDMSILKGRGLHYSNKNSNLAWDPVENTSGLVNIQYEVELKDAEGRSYNDLVENDNGIETLTNIITEKTSLSSIYSYVKIDDKYEKVDKSNGSDINGFIKGMKYTARLRVIADVKQEDGTYVTKQGEWSDKYEFVCPNGTVSSGINAKPAKVTGVWIDEDPGKDGSQYYPYIEWNKIENVSKYEIELKDAAGNLFVYSPRVIDGKYIPEYKSCSSNQLKLYEMAGLLSYSKKDGESLKTLRNAAGVPVHPFVEGQTYTFRVRAVNSYYEYKSDGVATPTVYHVGEWSDPVTYTTVEKNLKVTGLKYVKSDEKYYYFDLNADDGYSRLYYQVSTDPNFVDGSIVSSWREISVRTIKNTNYKFTISKSDLKPSVKYYVRVVNSSFGTPSNVVSDIGRSEYDSILSTASTTSFMSEPDEEAQPKNITGLKIYEETVDYFYFRFDAKLLSEDSDRFEVQLNNVPDDNSNWWVYSTDYSSSYSNKYDFFVLKSSLNEGDNYVRVVAYRYVEDEETGKKVKKYGKPSNAVKLSKILRSTSSIGTISIDAETDSNYVFKYSGNVRKNENVKVEFSTSSAFDTNYKSDIYAFTNSYTPNVNNIVSISKSSFRPGKTYYARMRVYNSNANKTENQYSAYSNVIKFTAAFPKLNVKSSNITKNSITIRMNTTYNSSWLSGYEVQRKSGSGKKAKWKTMSKSSSSVYTNKKLKAFKTYSYRVRPYFYDYDTKKTTYGTWVYTEAMTGWSGNLNLKATVASKTSVKLKWNKIKGAKGYEVYRRVANSASNKLDKGIDNNYVAYKLVKTLGAGKKTYTDKGLTTGMSYYYVVKAYKKVGKKKVYLEGSDGVSLDFVISSKSSYYNAKGKLVLNWSPVAGAKGYKIEKQDRITEKYSLYKTIKNAKTSSYTFPAASDVENGDYYRICAFNGNKISNYIYVTVDPILAAPSKVTAKVSGQKITISWSPVAGADFYRVYRTTAPYEKYNSSLGIYTYESGTEVGRYVPDASGTSGFRKCELNEMNVTSVTDQPIIYMKNGISQTYYKGPDTGVKYYYYVYAYKLKPQHGYEKDFDEVSDAGSSYYIKSYASKSASAEIKEVKPAKPVISKLSVKSKTVSVAIKGSVKAEGYEVQRSTNKKKGFKTIGEAEGLNPVYKDKYNKKKNKLKKKKTYYYRVRSYVYNDNGSKVYSAYSTVKKVKYK